MSSIGAGRTCVVLDRLFGVWWEGVGFDFVDRWRFLDGVASSGGRRGREVCILSYNLYLLARASFSIHQKLQISTFQTYIWMLLDVFTSGFATSMRCRESSLPFL